MDSNVEFGQVEQLPSYSELEEQSPKDTYYYCDRCVYKRNGHEKVERNLLYGTVCPLLWVYNLLLFMASFKDDSQYKFSESIEWAYKDEIALSVELNDDSLVSSVIKQHCETGRRYDRICGWSFLGLLLYAVLLWLLIMIL